jgi:hypothetical protein
MEEQTVASDDLATHLSHQPRPAWIFPTVKKVEGERKKIIQMANLGALHAPEPPGRLGPHENGGGGPGTAMEGVEIEQGGHKRGREEERGFSGDNEDENVHDLQRTPRKPKRTFSVARSGSPDTPPGFLGPLNWVNQSESGEDSEVQVSYELPSALSIAESAKIEVFCALLQSTVDQRKKIRRSHHAQWPAEVKRNVRALAANVLGVNIDDLQRKAIGTSSALPKVTENTAASNSQTNDRLSALEGMVTAVAKALNIPVAAGGSCKDGTGGSATTGASETPPRTSRAPQPTTNVFASGPVIVPAPKQQNQTKTISPYGAARPPKSMQSAFHPSRLIVIGRAVERGQRPSERDAVRIINAKLQESADESARRLRVVAVTYKPNTRTIVINTREDQRAEDLKRHFDLFRDALVLGDDAKSYIDEKWFKVQVHGIHTKGVDGVLYSEEEVDRELKEFNPLLATLEQVIPPRWMRSISDRAAKPFSSVVLTFAHEEDAIRLLQKKCLTAFGGFCDLRHHADRPAVIQCAKCQAIGHLTRWCPAKAPTCRICAGDHESFNHETATRTTEEDQRMDPTTADEIAAAPKKCALCGGPHAANDCNCPERAKKLGEQTRVTGGNAIRITKKGGKATITGVRAAGDQGWQIVGRDGRPTQALKAQAKQGAKPLAKEPAEKENRRPHPAANTPWGPIPGEEDLSKSQAEKMRLMLGQMKGRAPDWKAARAILEAAGWNSVTAGAIWATQQHETMVQTMQPPAVPMDEGDLLLDWSREPAGPNGENGSGWE